MGKRKTTVQFISDAIAVHGNHYDYTKVEYVNNKTKVKILCLKHGIFEQNPDAHINRKAGCPLCGIESFKLKRSFTKEEFIDRAKNVHMNKYSYVKTNYINSKIKVIIICPEHGEFSQRPGEHINYAQGCPKCACKDVTIAEFIKKAIKVHGTKYTYEKVEYVNNQTKVDITCPKHGTFSQTPASHLQGANCPTCSVSGFDQTKPAYLYYLKITTEDNQVLHKIGITNRTVNERFNLTDLAKIEIVKQKLYENGIDALNWETKLKRQYKEYQYKGPDILESGNTELFTEDILKLFYNG